jgi:hypothetical protein
MGLVFRTFYILLAALLEFASLTPTYVDYFYLIIPAKAREGGNPEVCLPAQRVAILCRDKDNKEIDILLESDGKLFPLEIKKTATPGSQLTRVFKIRDGAWRRRGAMCGGKARRSGQGQSG